MGPDTLLGTAPLLVTGVLSTVLLTLAVTTLPVLRGHRVTEPRIRAARWASAGILIAAVPIMFTESADDMHGFILGAGIISVAAVTLLRPARKVIP